MTGPKTRSQHFSEILPLISWDLTGFAPSSPLTASYREFVERLTKAGRDCAVAAAAAHDMNDELTVILSGVAGSLATLEPGHPARSLLLEARRAVQRCAWKTSGLLNYSARRGLTRTAAPMEALMEKELG